MNLIIMEFHMMQYCIQVFKAMQQMVCQNPHAWTDFQTIFANRRKRVGNVLCRGTTPQEMLTKIFLCSDWSSHLLSF